MTSQTRGLAYPLCLALLFAAVAACARQPEGGATPAAFRTAAAGGEWQLMELSGSAAPLGAGGRRATLVFDADTARAGGFGGCNRWGAGYTVSGDSLRFTAAISTKMACAEGMDLESRLHGAIEATRRYTMSGDELRLIGAANEPLARFERRRP
jgi:heat shock protein HslJ